MDLEQAERAYAEAQAAFDVAGGAWVTRALDPRGDAKERARMFAALADLNRTGIDLAWARAEDAIEWVRDPEWKARLGRIFPPKDES